MRSADNEYALTMPALTYSTQIPMNKRTAQNKLRRRAFLDQKGRCYWCGIRMTYPKSGQVNNEPECCTAEHLLPQSRGGRAVFGNIVAACRKCNNTRTSEAQMSAGDDTPKSPFEVLGSMIEGA